MEGRWRRLYPLEPTSNTLFVICCPWIICAFRSVCKSQINNVEEVHKAHSTQVRSIRTDYIPSLEGIWVIKVTTWHTCKSLEVLRKEGLINPNKELKELSLSMMFWILTSCKFAYPEIEGSKNTRYSTHTLYIMKMRNYIISIMQCNIYTSICKYNSSLSSNCKLNLKSLCKLHRCSQPKTSSIEGSQPTKDFNTCWNCNNHGCTSKVSSCINIKPYSIHMML